MKTLFYHDSPTANANRINPILYGENGLFSRRGVFYGWVLSDFVTEDTARTLCITNYPVHIHDMTRFDGQPATCTEDGRKQYYRCNTCGSLYLDPSGRTELTEADLVLPKTGHTPGEAVRENVKAPTRQASGSYEEVVYCTVCNAEISRNTTHVPPLEPGAVEYVDERGAQFWCNSYEYLTNPRGLKEDEDWTLYDGWYYMYDNVDSDYDEDDSRRLIINGDVNLIIGDGCTLYADSGIRVEEGSSLTIWTQRNGTGKLVAGNLKPENCAGIGGDNGMPGGRVIIHGGTITAYGGARAAGIGGGNNGGGGTLTVYGGKVKSEGGDCGSGIGGGNRGNGSVLTVYGGTVEAVGGNAAAGIGGGAGGAGGALVVKSGNVTARSTAHAAGIGGGQRADGGDVTISGGAVTAIGGPNGAGIGGGEDGSQRGTVRISGGKVMANGGDNGAGIGGGVNGNGGPVIISGGDVTAIGRIRGGGLGNGSSPYTMIEERNSSIALYKEDMFFSGSLTMTGGKLTAGGGDANAKWDSSNIENNTQSAWRSRFNWIAAAALKIPTITLSDDLMVRHGDSKDSISEIDYNTRRAIVGQTQRYVVIEPCDHANMGYRITDYGHIPACEHCKLIHGAEQKHSFNARYECTVCGYTQDSWKIEFNANGGSGAMDYVRVLKGQKYTLPECRFTAPGSKTFVGWRIDQSDVHFPGRQISVDADMELTAQWDEDFNLWVGDVNVTYENRTDVLGDGKVSYDPEQKLLTLNNVTAMPV